MGIFNLYSKRKRLKEKSGQADVYKYDELPEPLRVQIIHIWNTAIGKYGFHLSRYANPPNEHWIYIHDALCREYGCFELSKAGPNEYVKCCDFLLTAGVDRALDIIELSFVVIDEVLRNASYHSEQSPNNAIKELNERFKEHAIGYNFTNGIIIRIDDQFIHKEVVLPAIMALQDPRFKGASQEFLKAHEHYRKGNKKEAIAEALKSFESTMKTICSIKKWKVPSNATAKPLLDICFANGLIPQNLQGHFGALRATLESGLPTVSNLMARHGQGQKPVEVPEYIVKYTLHLAAANILFLIEASR